MNKKTNISLLTFMLLGFTALLVSACTKENDTDQGYTITTGQPVTPALYAAIKGKWNYCDPYYADQRKGWYMEFVNDTILVFNHQITIDDPRAYRDTFVYKLTQNTLMGPTGANHIDAVKKSDRSVKTGWSLDAGKSDGLYIGDQRYCKQ